MSERAPIYGRGALGEFGVTAQDGTRFRCFVDTVGRTAPHKRWILQQLASENAKGGVIEYIGDLYVPIDYLDELVAMVDAWWAGKKALGQAGMNAAVLRDRIANES